MSGFSGPGPISTPWTSASPTVTSSINALTSASCTLKYKLLGKTAIFTATVTVTTAGTGSGNLQFTLPFTPISTHAGGGKETAAVGYQCNWQTTAAVLAIAKYDNTTIIADGRTVVITGTIEVA
ncbi:hypothetical protein [Bradyrhizobium japonicum]|uniref:hypothetical protein n=1 Tax=Bradyrhizobium japonicum TaxID=375 RepID=UPI0035169362